MTRYDDILVLATLVVQTTQHEYAEQINIYSMKERCQGSDQAMSNSSFYRYY